MQKKRKSNMLKLLIHIKEHIINGDYELAIGILDKLIDGCRNKEVKK